MRLKALALVNTKRIRYGRIPASVGRVGGAPTGASKDGSALAGSPGSGMVSSSLQNDSVRLFCSAAGAPAGSSVEFRSLRYDTVSPRAFVIAAGSGGVDALGAVTITSSDVGRPGSVIRRSPSTTVSPASPSVPLLRSRFVTPAASVLVAPTTLRSSTPVTPWITPMSRLRLPGSLAGRPER